MKDFLIGADPEGFAIDQNGKPISVIPFIEGTKMEPFKTKNGFIHQDNVAWEIGFNPARTKEEFIKRVQRTLVDIKRNLKRNGLSLSKNPFIKFDQDQLLDPRSLVFLCNPDWNAWTLKKNEEVMFENVHFRSAAGHIHIGMELSSSTKKLLLVQLLDILIGVGSYRMESVDRRKFYGQAGSFREKPYGIEYRVPSNWWIWKKDSISFIYEQAQKAVNYLDKYDGLFNKDQFLIELITKVINFGHHQSASIIKSYIKDNYNIEINYYGC